MWSYLTIRTRRQAPIGLQTRILVAYLAGELILRGKFEEVHDFASGKVFRLRVQVKENEVVVRDETGQEQAAGGAYGNHYLLQNFLENAKIELTIAGKNFDGEDGHTGRNFRGYAEDNLITFFEGDSGYVFGLSGGATS